MVLLAETPAEIREAAERYGRKRSVSSMWFQAIQATLLLDSGVVACEDGVY